MIAIQYLPKIGDRGLAINQRLHTEDWAFHSSVAAFMKRRKIAEAWFQCATDNGEWVWFHGIVALQDGKAVITQVG